MPLKPSVTTYMRPPLPHPNQEKEMDVYSAPINPSPSNALFATPNGLMVDAESVAALRKGMAVPDKLVPGKYTLSFESPRSMIQIPEDADRLSLVPTKWSGQFQEVILQRAEGLGTNITLDWPEGLTVNGIEGPSYDMFGQSKYITLVRHSETEWNTSVVDLATRDEVLNQFEEIREDANTLQVIIRQEADQLVADVTEEVDRILPEARLAAATAQTFGARTMDSLSDLLMDETITSENTGIGATVYVRTMGLLSTTSDVTAPISNASGVKFEPITGNEVYLSQYGVGDGADATQALKRMFAKSRKNQRLIIDRDVTYSDVNPSLVLGLNNATEIEFVGNGKIKVPNLTSNGFPDFIKFTGELRGELTLTADIVAGAVSMPVSDASSVRVGDLLAIRNSNRFNGWADVSGFTLVYEEDFALVRQVVGNTIIFETATDFAHQIGTVTYIRCYNPKKRPMVINARIDGPSKPSGTLPNGQGETGVSYHFCVDPLTAGGQINGFLNNQVEYRSCYRTVTRDLFMDSLRPEQTTSNFYGVMNRGGRFALVESCYGQNIRRVADTQVGPLVADITHNNLIGIGCNGSAAGTHAGLRYSFNTITAINCSGTMSIRSKEVSGDTVISERCQVGIGVGAGMDPDKGKDFGSIRIHDIRMGEPSAAASTVRAAVSCYADGDYDLAFTYVRGWYGVRARALSPTSFMAHRIRGMKIRGKADGMGLVPRFVLLQCDYQLENVDISVDTKNFTDVPTMITGTQDQLNPAKNIRVHHCSDPTQPNAIVSLNPAVGQIGYIDGATCEISHNQCMNANVSDIVHIGTVGRHAITVQPSVHSNKSPGPVPWGRRRGSPVVAVANLGAVANFSTFLQNDMLDISTVAAGSYASYVTVTEGTTGTIEALEGKAIAGTIAAGGNEITVNSVLSKLSPGMFISLIGTTWVTGSSGSRARVKVISVSTDGLKIKVNGTANTAVTGAALSLSNPGFKGINQIEA